MALKAKIYRVEFGDQTYLVNAITKAGASRDLLEHLAGQAKVDLATGEEIYRHGLTGQQIIGDDRYVNAVDPNQLNLTGVPETAGEQE